NANLVYAGPSSGGAAAPSFRFLVTADLPGSLGTVTGVALTLTVPAFMTKTVTGSPITTSGTLALSFDFNPQAANTVLAGPVSGGSGPVTFRALSANDFPAGLVTVAFSATPSFDASAGSSFQMTLTGNVTFSTFSNGKAGQTYTFILKQDGSGGHTFT